MYGNINVKVLVNEKEEFVVQSWGKDLFRNEELISKSAYFNAELSKGILELEKMYINFEKIETLKMKIFKDEKLEYTIIFNDVWISSMNENSYDMSPSTFLVNFKYRSHKKDMNI